MVALSVLLTATVSVWFLVLTGFVAANLWLYSLAGFCPASLVLRWAGVERGCRW